jgi:hypothetical protein
MLKPPATGAGGDFVSVNVCLAGSRRISASSEIPCAVLQFEPPALDLGGGTAAGRESISRLALWDPSGVRRRGLRDRPGLEFLRRSDRDSLR